MTIPALMIVVSAAAPFPLVRWLSLGVGVLYILLAGLAGWADGSCGAWGSGRASTAELLSRRSGPAASP